VAPPTDPTNPSVTTEVAAIEDEALTDPRGGSAVTDIPDGAGIAPDANVTTIPPGRFALPGPPRKMSRFTR